MIRIRMLETRKGTPDGFEINEYLKDVEYEVWDHLAYAFINSGTAVLINNKGALNNGTT